MTELREKIAQLLIEPNISGMDWSLGSTILSNWKAGLPDRILALFDEQNWLKRLAESSQYLNKKVLT